MRKSIVLLALLFPAAASPAADGKPLWIVVTAPAFREALAPLVSHRRTEGQRVISFVTTDVLTPEQIRTGESAPLRDRVRRLAEHARGAVSILLVGAAAAPDGVDGVETVVPSGVGTAGRMAGEPTDHLFGAVAGGALPAVAVGRFPARSVPEAEAMVAKALAFEKGLAPGPWRDRLTLLVGDPGGSSPVEKQMAAWFLGGALSARFARLPPRWTVRAVVHSVASPFGVPDDSLRAMSRAVLEEGAFFAIYLGHSGAGRLSSGRAPFLTREDFGTLRIRAGPGVFFTCGCYACQTRGFGGEGYGLAAARNPSGPAAVIGAHGESYAVMGRLAADGLIESLRREPPPATLGEVWLDVLGGIARGEVDGLTFRLYDEADGSGGKVSLAEQRREHLEMWTLLGDPGMRLPPPPLPIPLDVEGTATPGGEVIVSGRLPVALSGVALRVTLERPIGPPAPGGAPEPSDPLARHERANDVVLSAAEVMPRDGAFRCVLAVPAGIPWPRLTIRATATTADAFASGVVSLPVTR